MGMKRTKPLWAFVLLGAVAWALIGCAAGQPPETPTLTPNSIDLFETAAARMTSTTEARTRIALTKGTPIPTSTFTPIPTPTFTPTPTLTPTPLPALDTLLPEAGPLCEAAFSANPVGVAEVPITSVLTLLRRDYDDEEGWAVYEFEHPHYESQSPLPFIGARYAPEVRTLACVKESRIYRGTYSPMDDEGMDFPDTDITAYQLRWTVRLVQWPEGNVTKAVTLTGPDPPPVISVSPFDGKDAEYGDAPYFPLLEWLLGIHGDPTILVTGNYSMMALSPDGAVLAARGGDDGEDIILWDVATGRKLHVLSRYEYEVSFLAFLPDGKTLVSAAQFENVMKLWNVESGVELRTLYPSIALGLDEPVLSPDGQVIALVDDDGNLYLAGHTGSVVDMAFSPDGSVLASGDDDGMVKMWDAAAGQEMHSLAGHTEAIIRLDFSPDGSVLASEDCDAMVKVWDVATGQELHTLSGSEYEHEGSCAWMHAAFSPDGETLVTTTWSGVIRLWDLETGRVRHALADPGHAPDEDSEFRYLSVFSPDGSILAVFNRGDWTAPHPQGDPTIRLWDVETGEERPSLVVAGSEVRQLVFSPDGKTLASASGDVIQLWDVATWQALRTLTGHTDTISSLVFSPDGGVLISRSRDGTIKLWDVDGES
jgi:WD40 repeat protein